MLKLSCCLSLLLLFSTWVFSQTTDFQTWSSISAEKALSKKWSVSLENELRLQDNSTRLRTDYIDVSAKYKWTKRFDVSGSYRFIVKPDKLGQRIYADFSYEQPLEKWTIDSRIRIQHQFNTTSDDENYLRPQVTLRYKLSKKWEPFIEQEFFYQLFYYQGDQFDESRTSAGTKYKFNKQHSLKGFYLYEYEFNVNDPLRANVIGVSYEYKW